MIELKKRIYEVLASRRVAALATVSEDGKPWVRYMVPRVDEDLVLTVASRLDSRKVMHIRKNPEVHLLTGVSHVESARNYVQVQGRADIITDPERKRDYWRDYLRAYFSGPEDPKYCLLRIEPYRIELYSMTGQDPEVWTVA